MVAIPDPTPPAPTFGEKAVRLIERLELATRLLWADVEPELARLRDDARWTALRARVQQRVIG